MGFFIDKEQDSSTIKTNCDAGAIEYGLSFSSLVFILKYSGWVQSLLTPSFYALTSYDIKSNGIDIFGILSLGALTINWRPDHRGKRLPLILTTTALPSILLFAHFPKLIGLLTLSLVLPTLIFAQVRPALEGGYILQGSNLIPIFLWLFEHLFKYRPQTAIFATSILLFRSLVRFYESKQTDQRSKEGWSNNILRVCFFIGLLATIGMRATYFTRQTFNNNHEFSVASLDVSTGSLKENDVVLKRIRKEDPDIIVIQSTSVKNGKRREFDFSILGRLAFGQGYLYKCGNTQVGRWQTILLSRIPISGCTVYCRKCSIGKRMDIVEAEISVLDGQVVRLIASEQELESRNCISSYESFIKSVSRDRRKPLLIFSKAPDRPGSISFRRIITSDFRSASPDRPGNRFSLLFFRNLILKHTSSVAEYSDDSGFLYRTTWRAPYKRRNILKSILWERN